MTLVIPDLHLRWKRADEFISKVPHDDIVFLGDYFDQFHDNSNSNQVMAEWLKESLKQPNRVHLLGNHDISYMFGKPSTQCSGYNEFKYQAINEVLKLEDWQKLKWFHYAHNTLFSHAGLSSMYLDKRLVEDKSELLSWLQCESELATIAGYRGYKHWFYAAGYARGGRAPVGGLVWLDYNREFRHIYGLNQIVGHTPQHYPSRVNVVDSEGVSNNLCLDTHTNHALLIDDKQMEVIPYDEKIVKPRRVFETSDIV